MRLLIDATNSRVVMIVDGRYVPIDSILVRISLFEFIIRPHSASSVRLRAGSRAAVGHRLVPVRGWVLDGLFEVGQCRLYG